MNKCFILEALFLDIQKEIDDFEMVVFDRILPSFQTIDNEAKYKSDEFLTYRNDNFNPDFHDEGSICEDAYFVQINYQLTHYSLRQDFLNLSAVWLYHIFERNFVKVFNFNKPIIKISLEKLLENSEFCNCNYDFKNCNNWLSVNTELRLLANSVKHGSGKSFAELNSKYPNLIVNSKIIVTEIDIKKYIVSMKNFWNLVLKDKFVTVNKDIL